MTATVLANELATLISEAKRKNVELRNAAEKSLHELKALPNTSEQQLAAGELVTFRIMLPRSLTDKRPQPSPGLHRALLDCLRDP